MTAAPDIVLLGNLLVDDIVLRDGRTLLGEPGGAVLHAALAAALWGAKVGICSVAGTDYPSAALDALAARGIDLAGRCCSGEIADRRDPVAVDGDVGAHTCRPSAVDDRAVADDQVVCHEKSPCGMRPF